jgi:hypothetical protein
MTVGDLVRPRSSVPQPLALANRMGPEKAMALALRAYLETLTFRVDGGTDPRDREFKLVDVLDRWPSGDVEIAYPSASVVEATPTGYTAHSLTPTPIDATWGVFDALVGLNPPGPGEPGATCLWKTGEAETAFQVDFWTDAEPDRQAIEGALDQAFNPHDGIAGVWVEGPELYFSRTVRFTLETTKRDDSAVSAGRGERRLRCSVRADCDIVSLRMATVTATSLTIEVVDQNDPPEEA